MKALSKLARKVYAAVVAPWITLFTSIEFPKWSAVDIYTMSTFSHRFGWSFEEFIIDRKVVRRMSRKLFRLTAIRNEMLARELNYALTQVGEAQARKWENNAHNWVPTYRYPSELTHGRVTNIVGIADLVKHINRLIVAMDTTLSQMDNIAYGNEQAPTLVAVA